VIFSTSLEGKVGHVFLEGKVGQPGQNLLQVTYGLLGISAQYLINVFSQQLHHQKNKCDRLTENLKNKA